MVVVAGVSSSSGLAFGHFCMFVSAVCISAVFTYPFLMLLQFHLISTFRVSSTCYVYRYWFFVLHFTQLPRLQSPSDQKLTIGEL